MAKVKRFIRQWWWVFVAAAAAVFAILWAILSNTGGEPDPDPKSSYKDKAQNEVEKVRLEGEIEKARITATADAERGQLDEIEAVGENDPAEGRRQMADWLAANL